MARGIEWMLLKWRQKQEAYSDMPLGDLLASDGKMEGGWRRPVTSMSQEVGSLTQEQGQWPRAKLTVTVFPRLWGRDIMKQMSLNNK